MEAHADTRHLRFTFIFIHRQSEHILNVLLSYLIYMQEEQFADITHQRRRQGEEKMPSFLTQWSMPKKETAKNTNKAVKKRS